MIELVDVLSEDGVPTGVTKAKRDVHRDGDRHRAAHVWVVGSDGRVLLQRRALVKESWPGLWDISVAGHVSAGETPLEAVIREAHEELGLVIAAGELTHLGTLRYMYALREDYIESEFHDVYLLRRDVALATLTLDQLEVAEVAWVALAELERYERVPHDQEYVLLFSALSGG